MASLVEPEVLTPEQIELVERSSMRLVFQAIRDFGKEAVYIFANSPDDQTEVAEDVTREAMARLPGFPLPARIFGVMDYKRAGYHFDRDFAVRQALLVDSKAEKTRNVARIQTSQTSLPIRQVRNNKKVEYPGELRSEMSLHKHSYIVTTIFVHYHYKDSPSGRDLLHITIAALPNGRLESEYVPSAEDTIFVAGPDSPLRGESFRTRLSFRRLHRKRKWRVQHLPVPPGGHEFPDTWEE